MNKYDEYFIFRIATRDDALEIMQFLKEEWGEKHILSNDKDFFLYHYAGTGNLLNVYLMTDKNGEIQGINGFVQYSDDEKRKYVSSAITKVRNDLPVPMCGIELIKRFKAYTSAKAYFSSGTNPVTMIPIGQRVFKYSVGIMKQYYLLNYEMKRFEMAVVPSERRSDKAVIETEARINKISRLEEIEGKFDFNRQYQRMAYKSRNYIQKRFVEHPIYQYDLYAIDIENKCAGILITRTIEVGKANVIRIVDYIGEITVLRNIGNELQKILQNQNAEYMDLLVSDFPKEVLSEAGFELRGENEKEIIIPTYFEPFVQENVNIWYQTSDKNIIIFKADGDQDRPNHR